MFVLRQKREIQLAGRDTEGLSVKGGGEKKERRTLISPKLIWMKKCQLSNCSHAKKFLKVAPQLGADEDEITGNFVFVK